MKTVIGSCTLYLGDSYEITKTLEYDGIVTDPPYEFDTQGGGRFRRNRQNMDKIQDAGLDKGFDQNILIGDSVNSVMVFCHNDQLCDLLPFLSNNYDRACLLSYHKSNPMPVANCHYQPDTEYWIHAWNKGAHPVGDLKDKKRYYFGLSGKDTEIDHPTVKPLPLMEKAILNMNAKVICDPFMGSGTTGLACMKQGKQFVGIEINPDFYQIAVDRMQEEYNQLSLF